MQLTELSPTARITSGLVCLFILYQLFISLTVGSKRRALQRQKGTLPAPWFTGCRDHFMGIDLFLANTSALREHRILETTRTRFSDMGVRTMQMTLLGRHVHMTIEPENLKVIQALEHKKWQLGTRRKFGFRQLLGDGM